jgi:DNA-binding transcriptional regulator YiaG
MTIPIHYRAAREFRELRLTVFGRGALAEHACADYLECSHRTLRRWETGHTLVPHAAVLRLRERLREATAA